MNKASRIQINLPINKTSVSTLEELRQNVTPELLRLYRDGRLEKFLTSRKCYKELAELTELANEEVKILKAIYKALGIDKEVIDKGVTAEVIAEMYAQPESIATEAEITQEPAVAITEPAKKSSSERQRPNHSGSSLKVPKGFRAAKGTVPEPYTNTGWMKEIIHEITGMSFMYIPAGDFMMGSPEIESGRLVDEVQHKVTLTKGFYLGKYEVLRGEWKEIMGVDPSFKIILNVILGNSDEYRFLRDYRINNHVNEDTLPVDPKSRIKRTLFVGHPQVLQEQPVSGHRFG